ncbi:VWA domain-containing protein, partial [bacterium AH-315-C07]|nr:VWA domain-containing protein [bacterium AH-315-C07]
MIRFENIEYLNLLYLLPLLVVIFWLAVRWRRKALKSFGDSELMKELMPDYSRYKNSVKFVIVLLAFSAVIFGLANPQIGTKMEEVKREGVDIIIALDVSKSMLAEDIKPNRLENAKHAISKLIGKLRNDRIGLIVFAGEAYVQLPLTADYNAAKLFLNTINPSIVPVPGTAIGASIELATRSFEEDDDKHKALIIITD